MCHMIEDSVPKPETVSADQALHAMVTAQNNAIEASARLAEGWPGAPLNLATAIRTLKRDVQAGLTK